ncbi:MAG: ribonuclease E/G, partial [Opitutae bacterium]|nr:ribonuclease E/G [Opitutae bacterium]
MCAGSGARCQMFEWLKKMGKSKKMKHEIIVNAESLETRVAIMADGHLEEFFIERPTEERIVGSIYKGRIQNMEDGLQAAFVDIGMKKNAFIHYWDMIPEDAARLEAEEGVAANRPRKKKSQPGEMAKQFPPGSEIIVQVTKGPIGTKGPRVTANLSIPGRYLVMMPGSKLKGVSRKIENDQERIRLKKALGRLPIPSGIGLIIRTSAEGVRATSFARDLRGLLDTWQKIEDGIKNTPAPCCLYHEP